ncbi:maestro heat-like repeat-containing protein family member 1 isoform X1 [Hemicordylus capensis]|uniref:maestro heat-like repeat-containing protein family member 1 isoform X1 n=1 Tax=Hemicordylus capensis TaxID=884348 RepID=UPI002303A852|nr:maestro heat-like repeat-containing protein family member 1 isoform X1 [Hemicordylus capensis]
MFFPPYSSVSGMHCSLDSSDQSQMENLELVEEVMVDRSTQTVWEDQSETERQSSRADWNQSGVSSMHCSLVSDQSQLEDHKLDEELTVGSPKERVSRWENMGYTDSQSSRAVWNQSGDSVVSSMYCSLFSSSSYHSEVEDWKVDEDLMEIIHRHMEDREERASNQDEDVHFLAVLCACCKAAYKSGQETLDLPYTKGQLIKEIVVVMEKSPVQSGPTILLLYAMAAVSCLSKIKPPTDPELESAILRFAVRGVIEVQAGHVHKQALHKLAADNLELMLRGFLSEAPTTQHLLSLLEHINIWILSRNAQERARASKQCASLLRFSVMMPDCDNSAELPSLGHHVAKLGICIMDCRKDVSRNAREGIYRLLEVLLHHKGQSSREAGELWSRRWQEEERILAYLNTARVGEVFREIFNKDQERSFLRTTIWAINHPVHRVKEAGLILLYSLLGKADALMGYEEDEIRRKIWRRLRQIKESKGLPEEIEGILKNQGNLYFQGIGEGKTTSLESQCR